MGKPDEATMAKLRLAHFEDAAKKYSEDGSGESGGDLGWMSKGQLDPAFEAAAWGLKPGVVSGIVHSKFGYHLIYVEGKEPAGVEPFDAVKSGIREYLHDAEGDGRRQRRRAADERAEGEQPHQRFPREHQVARDRGMCRHGTDTLVCAYDAALAAVCAPWAASHSSASVEKRLMRAFLYSRVG